MTDQVGLRWERWRLRVLPFPLLALATAVAVVTAPGTGSDARWRWIGVAILVPAVALWMWWWSPSRCGTQLRTDVYYVVRSVMALSLTLFNPLFCIFAWIGFLDAPGSKQRVRHVVSMLAVAFTMAVGQSGGLPPRDRAQFALLIALFVVNFTLGFSMARFAEYTIRISNERAASIVELEKVNRELSRALAENAELQQTVVAQAREAGVHEERQRLAREIHDTIAQSMAAVVAQLQAAQSSDDPSPRVARATELARDALAETRRSVLDLVPVQLSYGSLESALAGLVEDWRRDRRGISATFLVTGQQRDLHPEIEATVLRVAQEALANAGKHAHASRVGVTLTYDAQEVMLDVRDDGIGFDTTLPAKASSFGLHGMRQRAHRLAGSIEVETSPGEGVAVSLRLPALHRGAA